MNRKSGSSIAKKIEKDDYTIDESDFYQPEDKRYLKQNTSKSDKCYKFYKDFNIIYDKEDFFDN